MTSVPATEFKAKCLELMDRVAERRETFVITKRGKPLAKLAPLDPKPSNTLFGCLRGKAEITDDILRPVLPAEAWETLKKWDDLINPQQVKTQTKSRAISESKRKTR